MTKDEQVREMIACHDPKNLPFPDRLFVDALRFSASRLWFQEINQRKYLKELLRKVVAKEKLAAYKFLRELSDEDLGRIARGGLTTE